MMILWKNSKQIFIRLCLLQVENMFLHYVAIVLFTLISAPFFLCGEISELNPIRIQNSLENQLNERLAFFSLATPPWLLATDSVADKIHIYQANDATFLKSFGTSGAHPFELSEPNYLTLIDNIVFIGEQKNHRIQIVLLPEFTFLGFLGDNILKSPSSITAIQLTPKEYLIYILDQESATENTTYYLHQFHLQWKEQSLVSEWIDKKKLERPPFFIAADSQNQQLIIAQKESEKKSTGILEIYSLQNEHLFSMPFTSSKGQTGAVTLVPTSDNHGYWIILGKDGTCSVYERIRFQDYGQCKIKGDSFSYITSGSVGQGNQSHPFLYVTDFEGNISMLPFQAIIDNLPLIQEAKILALP